MPSPKTCLALLLLPLGACSTLPTGSNSASLYKVQTVSVENGLASWYTDHRTASGERFDVNALTAAHKKLPFGTKVRVVDLKTQKSVIVKINDRGPYIRGRVIDLTKGAARQLGMFDRGIAKVRVEVLKEIPLMTKPNLHVKSPPEHQDLALADTSPSHRMAARRDPPSS
jgi:rare lipoprotein A